MIKCEAPRKYRARLKRVFGRKVCEVYTDGVDVKIFFKNGMAITISAYAYHLILRDKRVIKIIERRHRSEVLNDNRLATEGI